MIIFLAFLGYVVLGVITAGICARFDKSITPADQVAAGSFWLLIVLVVIFYLIYKIARGKDGASN